MKFLIALTLISFSSPVFANDCSTLVAQSEKTADQGQNAEAKAFAMKAITACKKEKIKNARHYMVLASIASQEQDFPTLIKWCEEGLKAEPGLGLAYMNMGSGYHQMKQFDKAIEAYLTGLRNPQNWEAKLNFNLGFAYFAKAVDAEEYAKVSEGEKYFLASAKLDPSIGGNYFYLGHITQGRNDDKSAQKYFQLGCQKGDKNSCDSLEELKKRLASAPAAAPAATAPVAVSGDENKLWAELTQNYIKKGLPAAQAKSTVDGMKEQFMNIPKEQRLPAIQNMVNSTR